MHASMDTAIACWQRGAAALDALAASQATAQGHLCLALREVWTGGETLGMQARARIASAFACAVRNHYGASAFFSMASECAQGQLHANTDWLVLAPMHITTRAGFVLPRGASGMRIRNANTGPAQNNGPSTPPFLHRIAP